MILSKETKTNMTMILPEDLSKHLSEYDDTIYSYVRSDNSEGLDQLECNIYDDLDTIYELSDKTDYLSISKEKYLRDYVQTYFREKVSELNERIRNRVNIIEKVEELKKLDLPEQRSKEWYEIREKILTASSLADAIGEGHFSTKEELLLQKCGGPRGKVPFEIVEWGVMYEPIATKFYELMNHLTVLEFGLVPHPLFKIFGASPDGICDIDSPEEYIGRMLEIKCPPRRQFTKEVPRHYWMQMQGQLESCDLEECDFLQVKIIEYLSEQDYKEDSNPKEGYSELDLPKGLLLAFVTYNPEGNPTIKYEYPDFNLSFDELLKWSEHHEMDYKEREIKYDKLIKHWWKIERYECSLVGRDRKWWLSVQPKIIDFWEDVEHYRIVGIQELLSKKEEKKIKRIQLKKDKNKDKKKPKKTIYEIDKSFVEEIQKTCFIDSDSD